MKEEKNITASAIRCAVRAPSPQACGYKDWQTVREMAEKYPHLRPCPKKNWWWIYRKNCLDCVHRRSDEPRSGSEAKTAFFASDSECQEGRLTERHLKDKGENR